jgi:hypothetical protein
MSRLAKILDPGIRWDDKKMKQQIPCLGRQSCHQQAGSFSLMHYSVHEIPAFAGMTGRGSLVFRDPTISIWVESGIIQCMKLPHILLTVLIGLWISTSPVTAQQPIIELSPVLEATSSIDATSAAEQASPAAQVQERIEERKQEDLTETRGAVKSRLAQVLDENPIGDLAPWNVLQSAIRTAVNQGVPANMLVLLILFPVIASVIAFSRHVIGLQGFGIYTPAVLAVAFVSTGIVPGIVLFLVIVAAVTAGKILFRGLKLEYLPRTALTLWLVSLIVFLLLVISPYLIRVVDLVSIGIFPILVLILLSENFLGTQASVSQQRLIELTVETLGLAIICALMIATPAMQEFVILHPELVMVAVAAVNLVVGKYTGLRLAEYFRFRSIIEDEE